MKLLNMVLMVLLASCGEYSPDRPLSDGDGGTAMDANSPIDPCEGQVDNDDVVDCYIESVCEYQGRCEATINDSDECDDQFEILQNSGEFVLVTQRLKAQSTMLRQAVFQQCLKAISEVPCGIDIDELAPCQNMFQGTIAADESCYVSQECLGNETGARCNSDGSCGDQACCVGRCVPPIPVGESCEGGNKRCAESDHCVLGKCESGAQGSICEEDRDCDEENHCPNSSILPFLAQSCVPDFSPGADNCNRDAQCPALQHCVVIDAASNKGCRDVDTLDARCEMDCVGKFACKDNACAKPAEAGEECIDNECGSNTLYCNSGTCAVRQAPGQPCTSQETCQIGSFCDPTDETCKQHYEDGATCLKNVECQSLYCDNGKCTEYPVCD